VLRHELNNPLTGILGNAELLLSEIRRKSDGRFVCGNQCDASARNGITPESGAFPLARGTKE
jgi:signal transduction histidine kinase